MFGQFFLVGKKIYFQFLIFFGCSSTGPSSGNGSNHDFAMKDAFGVPTYAYQVSGEYAMLKAAAAQGWLDGERAMYEVLLGFKRAGADGILTYAALDIARSLQNA